MQEFIYDRFVNGAKFYKDGQQLKHPIMSFGSLCPGKRFALLELKWFLLSIISRFQLRYRSCSSPMPNYDARYHGHEVLPPVSDVDIQFRPRSHFRRIQLACE